MRNILPYGLGWGGKICWAICFYLFSPNIRLQNDIFSRQHVKKSKLNSKSKRTQKVSRTLRLSHLRLLLNKDTKAVRKTLFELYDKDTLDLLMKTKR